MPPEDAAEEALTAADATTTEGAREELVATTGVPDAAEAAVTAAPAVAEAAAPAVAAAEAEAAAPAVAAAEAAALLVAEPVIAPVAAAPAVVVLEPAVQEIPALAPALGAEPAMTSSEASSARLPTPDLDFGPAVEARSVGSELLDPPSIPSRPSVPRELEPVPGIGDAAPSHREIAEMIDPSSISGEFFQRDDGSVPPLIDALGDHNDHDADDDPIPGLHLSPEALARRARLRRIVAGVVGLAGVISLAVVGKAVMDSRSSSSRPQPIAAAPRTQVEGAAAMDAKPRAVEALPAPAPVEPAAKAEPQVAAEPAKAEPPATEPAKAEPPATEPAKAEPPATEPAKVEAPAAVSPADAAKLKRQAESFLNRGKMKDAIEAARGAIAADPSDAMTYLYLGSALQDSGKWKEGIAAYSDCVRNAKKGPINECFAMGGRK